MAPPRPKAARKPGAMPAGDVKKTNVGKSRNEAKYKFEGKENAETKKPTEVVIGGKCTVKEKVFYGMIGDIPKRIMFRVIPPVRASTPGSIESIAPACHAAQEPPTRNESPMPGCSNADLESRTSPTTYTDFDVEIIKEEPKETTPKQSTISSSSSSTRRPRDAKIISHTNYGSEEELEEDDEDCIGHQIVIPRAARIYLNAEDILARNSTIIYEWPPVRANSAHSLPTPSSLAPPVPVLISADSSDLPLEPNCKFDFKWRGFSDPQPVPGVRREPFCDINCGPTVRFDTPYDVFTAIWDRGIMEHIATQTNIYAQQLTTVMVDQGTLRPHSRITKWQDTNVDELHVYFAIIQATGLIVKTCIEEYWNSNKDIFSTPGFSTNMKFDRFLLLSRCLHFNNNEACDPELLTRPQAKLFKIQPVIDHLNYKFSSMYNLSRNIALDESLTMWKSWLDINQFIPNKAATVGIKTYEVCESHTGYLWRFEVHAGHETSTEPQEDSPVSAMVPALVLRLLNGLEHRGHTVWMDHFYNSPALARELKVRGFDCVGTLRLNSQFVPVELSGIEKNDMAEGQLYGCTSGDVDLLVWRDRNCVAFVSTYHGLATAGDTPKPTVALDYNVCMGGVDRKDQMLAMFPVERRRNKTWYKNFFRRLLNASILNSYIQFKQQHTGISHRKFRKTLVSEILFRHSPQQPNVVTTFDHFPSQYGLISPSSYKNERTRKACAVCKKRTNVYCSACDVPLCVFTCFKPYHRQH